MTILYIHLFVSLFFHFDCVVVNKGRSVSRGSRTSASAVPNKPREGIARQKIQASRPVLEASAAVEFVDDAVIKEEQYRGRAGSVQENGGRIKPSRPRPTPSEVNIEGSMISFEEPSVQQPPIRSKTALAERLKISRPSSSVEIESSGSGSVVSSYSLIKSHVDVSSRVDIRIGGLPKVNQMNPSLMNSLDRYNNWQKLRGGRGYN